MQRLSLLLSALIVLCLAAQPAATATPEFLDLRDLPTIRGVADAGKARATACMACHGQDGIALVPQFPNLAGQHMEYLYTEMLRIRRAARADSPMTAQLSGLDDASLRDLAAWFASLPAPRPTLAADGRGRALYRHGDAARGVPPCQGCHGPDGDGHALAASQPHWRVVPILRGQNAAYLAQRLRDFRAGLDRNSSSAHLMSGIAATLSDADIEALAQWIGAALPIPVVPSDRPTPTPESP